MSHKTFEELSSLLDDASGKVHVGAQYVHYKDSSRRYEVTGLSILEADDEVAVRYASVDEPHVEFVRPLYSWLEDVTWKNKIVPRFRLV